MCWESCSLFNASGGGIVKKPEVDVAILVELPTADVLNVGVQELH